MKKIILTLCVAAGLVSCTSEADQKAKLGAANMAFYTRVFDVAVNEGRTDIFDSAYVDDAVLHTVPEVKGKVNAKAYYMNYVTGFSERQFIVKEMFADGDKLVKYWEFKGKHTGDFFGIPASGNYLDLSGTTIVTMRDGKIAKEHDFFNMQTILDQLTKSKGDLVIDKQKSIN